MHYVESVGHDSTVVDLKAGISFVIIVLEALKVIATTILICWHIYLQNIGITTYQYLVEKEELMKLEDQAKSFKITREEYEDRKRQILDARKVQSVHKIKKSNVITPVGKRK